MKKINLTFAVFLFLLGNLFAQNLEKGTLPEFQIKQQDVEAQLRFLASDFLKGRRTGSEGNKIAAQFIASNLEAYGYQSPEGAPNFLQPIPFVRSLKPSSSTFTADKTTFKYKEDYVIIGGGEAEIKSTAVFAGHGWVDKEKSIDDYSGLDVKGKVVFVLPGLPDDNKPLTIFNSMVEKQRIAGEKGAVAIVEIFNLNFFPWQAFRKYFGGESILLSDNKQDDKKPSIPYGWVKNILEDDLFKKIKEGKKVKIKMTSSGVSRLDLASSNVIGFLEGSDPELKKEHLILTAHFDHVGVGKEGGGPTTPTDSIFNGARDNAMGTVALLSAAKAFGQLKPKRSVIVLAVTGEEIGLLGSKYYSENPLFPLNQAVFNLNTDGAGYNDKSYVAVIGYGRTGTDDYINQSAEAVGLKVYPDPAPEQGLFDRSDNVSFASKGIPALNFSPGLTSFDAEISKYYHQVADEANAVDMNYLLKYCQAYAHLARLIADSEEKPWWIEGDKYEAAGKKLYNRE